MCTGSTAFMELLRLTPPLPTTAMVYTPNYNGAQTVGFYAVTSSGDCAILTNPEGGNDNLEVHTIIYNGSFTAGVDYMFEFVTTATGITPSIKTADGLTTILTVASEILWSSLQTSGGTNYYIAFGKISDNSWTLDQTHVSWEVI
jgi:hypothetical protein